MKHHSAIFDTITSIFRMRASQKIIRQWYSICVAVDRRSRIFAWKVCESQHQQSISFHFKRESASKPQRRSLSRYIEHHRIQFPRKCQFFIVDLDTLFEHLGLGLGWDINQQPKSTRVFDVKTKSNFQRCIKIRLISILTILIRLRSLVWSRTAVSLLPTWSFAIGGWCNMSLKGEWCPLGPWVHGSPPGPKPIPPTNYWREAQPGSGRRSTLACAPILTFRYSWRVFSYWSDFNIHFNKS